MSVSSIAKQQSSIGVHSNHLKLGIIGTANVGKSSLFNVLVDRENRKSPSENCLFRTIDPYIASFTPYDPVIDYVSSHLNISAIPASLTVVDTAGLVEGSFREVSALKPHCFRLSFVQSSLNICKIFYYKRREEGLEYRPCLLFKM